MDGGPNDVNLKNSTHIPGISIHYIPKDVPTRPNGRVPIVEIEEIFTLHCCRSYAPYRLRRRLLRTHTISEIRGR